MLVRLFILTFLIKITAEDVLFIRVLEEFVTAGALTNGQSHAVVFDALLFEAGDGLVDIFDVLQKHARLAQFFQRVVDLDKDFAGMLGAMSKDFLNLIKSLSTAIFWMSGIIYDVNEIHNKYLRFVLKLNPVTFISSGYRDVFIYKKWIIEDKVGIICYLITLVATILGAIWAYKRLRKEIPDVL